MENSKPVQLTDRLCDVVIECAQLHGDVTEALELCDLFVSAYETEDSAVESASPIHKWLDERAYVVLGEGDEFAFEEVCRASRIVLEIAVALDETNPS
jgi:hypothetical protein